MLRIWSWSLLLTLLSFAPALYAGSVYTWTDDNGVRHYSNINVPDGAELVVTSQDDNPPQDSDVDQPPPEQEQTTAEDQVEAPPEQTAESAATDEQTDEDPRVAEERALLEGEIQRVETRAVSRTFSPGMKRNRLKPLYARLSLLNANPEKYFEMKAQGRFKELQPQDQESQPLRTGSGMTSSSPNP